MFFLVWMNCIFLFLKSCFTGSSVHDYILKNIIRFLFLIGFMTITGLCSTCVTEWSDMKMNLPLSCYAVMAVSPRSLMLSSSSDCASISVLQKQ